MPARTTSRAKACQTGADESLHDPSWSQDGKRVVTSDQAPCSPERKLRSISARPSRLRGRPTTIDATPSSSPARRAISGKSASIEVWRQRGTKTLAVAPTNAPREKADVADAGDPFVVAPDEKTCSDEWSRVAKLKIASRRASRIGR